MSRALIQQLEGEWKRGDGTLGELRAGRFDKGRGDEFLALLTSIKLDEQASVSKRLVSLLWYIPSFVEWQRDRVAEAGSDMVEFERFTNQVRNQIERILGVP